VGGRVPMLVSQRPEANHMPRNQRPSFLKRQKEQNRLAKAQRKRDERRARRPDASVDGEPGSEVEVDAEVEATAEKEEGVPEA